MNKFLLTCGLVALLAGCDRAAENNTTPVQNDTMTNDMVSVSPSTPAQPSAPATTDNTVSTDRSDQMQTTSPTQGAVAGQEQPDNMVRSNDQPNESSNTSTAG